MFQILKMSHNILPFFCELHLGCKEANAIKPILTPWFFCASSYSNILMFYHFSVQMQSYLATNLFFIKHMIFFVYFFNDKCTKTKLLQIQIQGWNPCLKMQAKNQQGINPSIYTSCISIQNCTNPHCATLNRTVQHKWQCATLNTYNTVQQKPVQHSTKHKQHKPVHTNTVQHK